jgi:hypothetical protein
MKQQKCNFQLLFVKKPALLLALSLIGGCNNPNGATAYYGAESFTLIAITPANFGLTSKSQYSPQAGQDCRTYSAGLGGYVTRQHQKTDEIDVKNVEQTAWFDIPLSYRISGCKMELTRVDVAIDGRYGTSSLDIGGDVGRISVAGDSSHVNSAQPWSGNPEFRGLCTWLFQLSVARIEKDGISKILSCSAANTDWIVPSDYFERSKPGGAIQRSSLNGKNVKFTFRLSKDEEPSMLNRWIKTTGGWRPCQGSTSSNRCQTPPTFRTFKMNDRECVVYPNCTE